MSGDNESKQHLNSAQGAKALPGIKRGDLTQEKLKELIHYAPETGIITWAKGRPGAKKGAAAGNINPQGYRRIHIDGRVYLAHRLAFLFMEGYFPENEVDHINRNRDDNRYTNLREATRECNARNCSVPVNNTSGIVGVYRVRGLGRWTAYITIKKRTFALGTYKTKLEAAYARFAAEQCLGFQDCDLSSSALQFIKSN